MVLDAGVDEFLLICALELEPGDLLQVAGRAKGRVGDRSEAEIIVLVGTQPTPDFSLADKSVTGKPLPRTRPAISQVHTSTIGSLIMAGTPRPKDAHAAIRASPCAACCPSSVAHAGAR